MFPNSIPPLTAFAGGGKASATPLRNDINVIGICVTAGDSVLLPPASVGSFCEVIHNGASAAQVFGSGSDTVAKVSSVTGVLQPPYTTVQYKCTVAGNWVPLYSFTHNLLATTDPVATNDSSQGYGAGSMWFNTTTSREWTCLAGALGAATWSLSGVVPGTGMEPSNMLTQFGASAFGTPFNAFGEEGNLYRNVGNPIAANLADTTDDILDGFVLPANAFDQAKRGLQLTFQGKFGSTANNKRFRIWANPAMAGQTVTAGVISGGTVTGAGSGILLFDSGTQIGNNIGWSLLLQLFKYGAANSNTQYAQAQPIYGATHGGVSLPTFATLVENAAVNIVVTGASLTTGAANDVVLNFSEVNAMN